MVTALQCAKLYVNEAKGIGEMSKGLIQCACCSIIVTFPDDDLLLGSKPYHHSLLVTSYIRE